MEYLAYGSNMLTSRLVARVPSARNPRVVSLPGYVVRYRKRSVDGSAKCDLVRDETSTAYGVVFTIDPCDKHSLDSAEGLRSGYREESFIVTINGRQIDAFAYVADRIDQTLRPYRWYRDLVVRGAREHGLPSAYIDEQLDVDADDDPRM